MPRFWLCQWGDVEEGQSRGFHLGGDNQSPSVAIIAVKKNSQLYLYRNLCPHAWIPLEWVPDEFLTSDGSLIQCANHGALFTLDTGECIAGPCTGQALQALSLEREGKHVYVYLDEM